MLGFLLSIVVLNSGSSDSKVSLIICLIPFGINILVGFHSFLLLYQLDEERKARHHESIVRHSFRQNAFKKDGLHWL